MDFFQPWHLIIVGVLAFLLFGAKRLPELGKGLGEGLKGFKEGIKGVVGGTDTAPTTPMAQHSVTPAPAPPVAPAPPPAPIEPK
jgi:sec-independent protein translocase protein TatA